MTYAAVAYLAVRSSQPVAGKDKDKDEDKGKDEEDQK